MQGALGALSGHIIICGAEQAFLGFVRQLRACDSLPTPVVVLHPSNPITPDWGGRDGAGPSAHLFHVAGSPSDGVSLFAARAAHARSLVFLAHPQRPAQVQSTL